MRVLIAEDEDALRGLLARLMRREGHDVTEAKSAEEALLLFREKPASLVLTDIVMGKMSGLDLLLELKSHNTDCTVVVMTSYATMETASAAVRAGAYDFMIKPFEDLNVVRSLVRRVEDRVALLEENRRLAASLQNETARRAELDKALAATLVRDDLTGLYNPQHFEEMLAAEASRSLRHGRTFSLLFAEVVRVGPENSADDRPIENQQLRAAANLVASRCRTSDIAARWGARGIAVLLPETDRTGAAIFAREVRRKVEAHFAGGAPGTPERVSLRIGTAMFPEDGREVRQLLDSAGAALRQATLDEPQYAGTSMHADPALEPGPDIHS